MQWSGVEWSGVECSGVGWSAVEWTPEIGLVGVHISRTGGLVGRTWLRIGCIALCHRTVPEGSFMSLSILFHLMVIMHAE